MTSKPSHNYRIKRMVTRMQNNISEWTVYIPYINCNDLLLISRSKSEPNAVKSSFRFWSCDKVYKMAVIVQYINAIYTIPLH